MDMDMIMYHPLEYLANFVVKGQVSKRKGSGREKSELIITVMLRVNPSLLSLPHCSRTQDRSPFLTQTKTKYCCIAFERIPILSV